MTWDTFISLINRRRCYYRIDWWKCEKGPEHFLSFSRIAIKRDIIEEPSVSTVQATATSVILLNNTCVASKEEENLES